MDEFVEVTSTSNRPRSSQHYGHAHLSKDLVGWTISTNDTNYVEHINLFPPDQLCPGWIDMCGGSGGTYTRVHAFVVSKDKVVFFSVVDFHLHFRRGRASLPSPVIAERGLLFQSPRLSHEERVRRRMGDVFSRVCQSMSRSQAASHKLEARIQHFQQRAINRFDSSFMKRELLSTANNTPPNNTKQAFTQRYQSPLRNILPVTLRPLGSQSSPVAMRPLGSPSSSFVEVATTSAPTHTQTQHHHFEGFLARAVSERHWVEQFATLTKGHVCFYHASAASSSSLRTRKPPSYRICLDSILNIRPLASKQEQVVAHGDGATIIDSGMDSVMPNFPGFYFSAIDTPGRIIYCMHPTLMQRNEWIKVIACHTGITTAAPAGGVISGDAEEGEGLLYRDVNDSRAATGTDTNNDMKTLSCHVANTLSCHVAPFFRADYYASDDPVQEFMHKSSLWNCKSRRILNCRQFCFQDRKDDSSGAGLGGKARVVDPLQVVETALRKVFAVKRQQEHDQADNKGDDGESETARLCSFLDCAARLKAVDMSSLIAHGNSDKDERRRKTFFLNVYHVMTMHAFLVLGPPTTTFQWLSYFNMISYQVGDDIFSLAELEHCLMRPNMSHPSQLISRFVLPKTNKDYEVCLENPDVRLLFAMNCGSLSNPKSVPIYKVATIENQLDQATTMYFKDTSAVLDYNHNKKGHLRMLLPKMCSWYMSDLSPISGSPVEALHALHKYLPPDVQTSIAPYLRSYISGGGGEDDASMANKRISFKFAPYSFTCRFLTVEDKKVNNNNDH
jgi:hypothetical protein